MNQATFHKTIGKFVFLASLRVSQPQPYDDKVVERLGLRGSYEGTLKDGKLTGQISSDRAEFSANGARIKPRPAILGEWGMKLMFQEREFEIKSLCARV